MSDNTSNNTNSSTLNSYITQASGAIQSAIGNLTGNTSDQVHGDVKQNQAQAENELSHAVGKAGPYAISGSGAIAKDDPNRSEGSWNQTIGAAKEALGGFIGAEGLKNDGIKQNQQGKEQEAQGQLNDLGKGVSDRVTGAVGGAIAGLTGDRAAQAQYQEQHDIGKTAQRSVEADLQKSQQ